MEVCSRFGKWIGGCRFEPRFDEGKIDEIDFKVRGYSVEDIINSLKPRTYIRDVCIRCGNTIERESGKVP